MLQAPIPGQTVGRKTMMIEISSPNDIVVPFEKIGDDGWEIRTAEIINSVLEEFGDDPAEPIGEARITELEARLGTTLPGGLKLFYESFGVANIGEELLVLEDISWLKAIWADAPEYCPDFSKEDEQHLPWLVTFSDYLGNGSMFCFHSETKEVYYFDHDTPPCLTKLFDSVDDYIRGCLVFVQGVLPAEGVNTNDLAQWVKQKVVELFGEDVVSKWRY